MTITDFRKALQTEITAGYPTMVIDSINDSGIETDITFTTQINTELLNWLDGRFKHGVSRISGNACRINSPYNSNRNQPKTEVPDLDLYRNITSHNNHDLIRLMMLEGVGEADMCRLLKLDVCDVRRSVRRWNEKAINGRLSDKPYDVKYFSHVKAALEQRLTVNNSVAKAFGTELQALLLKYNVSIDWSCDDSSDMCGVTGQKMVITNSSGFHLLEINGSSIEAADLENEPSIEELEEDLWNQPTGAPPKKPE